MTKYIAYIFQPEDKPGQYTLKGPKFWSDMWVSDTLEGLLQRYRTEGGTIKGTDSVRTIGGLTFQLSYGKVAWLQPLSEEEMKALSRAVKEKLKGN